MTDMYKKIKKMKGERFARVLRDHNNGIFEIPDLPEILRHAGDDAKPLLPHLTHMLIANDNDYVAPEPEDPFNLLAQAGYKSIHADTMDKQNSIRSFFREGEKLCTFDSSRYKTHHIVYAIKENAADIAAAPRGQEQREDEYSTSVMGIMMGKSGGSIKITSRYNHTVNSPDHTHSSNPDNIIDGLSAALKNHFDIDFNSDGLLPDKYLDHKGMVFKHHDERNNIYFGDNAYLKDGKIHTIDKTKHNALFERFIFDNKTKTLINIDDDESDSFAENFNRTYGGNKDLHVKNGNLMLGDDTLITAENSKITDLYLPGMTEMTDNCLRDMPHVKTISAPDLIKIGNECLHSMGALTHLDVSQLQRTGNDCLCRMKALTEIKAQHKDVIPKEMQRLIKAPPKQTPRTPRILGR